MNIENESVIVTLRRQHKNNKKCLKLGKEGETKLRKTPCVTKQWIRKICRVPGLKLKNNLSKPNSK